MAVDTIMLDYQNRINRYVNFELVVLRVPKRTKLLSNEELKRQEGDLLLNSLGERKQMLILLDENGTHYTSTAFSTFVEKNIETYGNLTFAIGGAYGFSDAVYQQATRQVALSSMTFSHQLIRIIFLEQLYRAFSILNNEPYHHQ